MKKYRYPGVRPFEAADKALFFGRDRDIADLYEMVRAERLVVLFGKSGYGKSSLLNAGVLPRLSGLLTPLVVRMGQFADGHSLPPVEMVMRKVPLPKTPRPETSFLQDLPSSLWTHFKQLDSTGEGKYLLVFDQFEEFFSYPLDQQHVFRDQLADLLNGELPDDLQDIVNTIAREQRRVLMAPLDIKVLFAIRSDHLHELDGLKDRLPAILHERYELKALSKEQAREAIVQPALLGAPPGNTGAAADAPKNSSSTAHHSSFFSPPFEYREDALEKILSELSNTDPTEKDSVEAFQLQILCESIENKVEAGQIRDRDGNGLPDVTIDDLPDFTDVFSRYYERRLALLPDAQRDVARRVIEDGLVYYDPETEECHRLSMDEQVLLKDYEAIGLNTQLLRELVSTFLIRSEQNAVGGHNYELSHDTLLAPVVRARKKRITEEEVRRRKAEIAAEEARIALEKAESKRRIRRALITSFVAAALVFAALVATYFAIEKTKQAEKAAEQAVIALLETSRRDIKELRYDSAFIKMTDAAGLEQVKDSVAFELMEIAFFRYHVRDSIDEEVKAPFLTAARLLDKTDILMNKDSFGKSLFALDSNRYNFLKARYFPRMIEIKGDTFKMGSDAIGSKSFYPSSPSHSVTVSDFKLAETETTVWQYNLYLAAQGKNIFDSETIERPAWGWEGDNPVVNVSWKDAVEYANWLSLQQHLIPVPVIDTGGGHFLPAWNALGYRLPTEAEWEYAARGGMQHDTFQYSGSNDINTVAWYRDIGDGRTHPVKTFNANGAGIYDMSGNAWEWCWDWLGPYPKNGESVTDPQGPGNAPVSCEICTPRDSSIENYKVPRDGSGNGHVLRGGSAGNKKEECLITNRNTYTPGRRRNDDRGFRVARSE